ncbi:coproporphyrinogen III oxidase family protein [Caldichromatium japonicum]|uniref:Coproporphyrinogen III oxidase family protein n=1 Tax=Caldichromatium japonicum TaxID=2699430 RepID=A0A6G7VBK8_9GAMM|nr:coproporphyrinogen-III oxidase family protein [Caldichromatium japonicum]QIK37256.1 coproporphyrinogen III oxidase family protein [Caldichromatium japonicum]
MNTLVNTASHVWDLVEPEHLEQRVQEFRRLRELGMIAQSGDFFPSVHYPPITMYPPAEPEQVLAGYTLPPDGLFDVYLHVPFCERRCIFCHYPVKFGKFGDKTHPETERYLAALEREMDIFREHLGIDRFVARSILVGGGTPTLLTPAQLDRMLTAFKERVDCSRVTQFNFDVDPGTLVDHYGAERRQILRSHGVDRLTIGIQSLDDKVLAKMHRPHDVKTALAAIDACQADGFQLNIEFIFGYPGQTLEGWMEMIAQAVRLGVDEIQLYRLKIESYGDAQGPIDRIVRLRPQELPVFEDAIRMKQAAIDILAAHGYHENLRRVFSKEPSKYSHYAHNQCCQLYDEVGFGLTAFSSLRDRFLLNTQSFEEYYQRIDSGRLPANRGLKRSLDDQKRWAAVLPLKNRDIDKALYRERTGIEFADAFPTLWKELEGEGLVEDKGAFAGLTKKGAFFADEVCHQFHTPAYIPFAPDEYAPGRLNPYRTQAVV